MWFTGTETKTDKIANYVVIAITVIASLYAVRFMGQKTKEVKPQVIYNRRKYRFVFTLSVPYGMC